MCGYPETGLHVVVLSYRKLCSVRHGSDGESGISNHLTFEAAIRQKLNTHKVDKDAHSRVIQLKGSASRGNVPGRRQLCESRTAMGTTSTSFIKWLVPLDVLNINFARSKKSRQTNAIGNTVYKKQNLVLILLCVCQKMFLDLVFWHYAP